MPFDATSLPRDPDRLIEIIVALQDRNAHLEGMVAALKRTVYGPRSEKLVADTAQLPLDLDDLILSDPSAAATMTLPARSLPGPAHRDQRRHETSVPYRSTCHAMRW